MENKEFAMQAAEVLNQKKGIGIKVIDIAGKSSFADYLIVASGGSDRQVAALSDAVEDHFEELGITPRSIAGKNNTGWVLMDYGDVIVNIFNPELRERYNLEQVWGDCSFLEIKDQ